MSYMRGDPYIYRSGDFLHIFSKGSSVKLSTEDAEDLAAMIFCELARDGRVGEVLKRSGVNWAGNFGADGVQMVLGEETALEWLKRQVADDSGGSDGD